MGHDVKDMLEIAIANNDSLWEVAVIDKLHGELERLYSQEAKAKAYNDTLKTLDKLINDDERYKEARSNDFVAGMLIAYENIFNLMEDYIKESGERNDEK